MNKFTILIGDSITLWGSKNRNKYNHMRGYSLKIQ